MILGLIIAGLHSCTNGQPGNSKKHIEDSKARQLNDSAIKLIGKGGSYEQAILLLNKATEIDSDYFTAYWNKIAYQNKLKKYSSALKTATELNRLRPNMPEYYVTVGMLAEKTGDTISCNKYYKDGLAHFNNILDTMNEKSKNYGTFMMDKAICRSVSTWK